MPKKSETPFHKILVNRNKMRMYVEYGDNALDGQTPQEFVAEILECVEYLVEFRNIINGMVALDEPPSRAVIPYLSKDVIAELDAR